MPSVIAKGSLAALGLETHWSPFFVHAIIEWVVTNFPRDLVLNKILGANIATQKRALRRQGDKKQN